jgi:hypothetical protein
LDARYPDGDYFIIQDHAPKNIAKVSKKATELLGLPIITNRTAQSWDQNVIENVWGVFRGVPEGGQGQMH